MRRLIADTPFEATGSTITISLGISERTPGASAASILRTADRALYAAKAGGRNRAHADRPERVEITATTPLGYQ